MPHIVTIRSKVEEGHEAIAVVLSQDAVCLGPDGHPWPGVSLSAQDARKLAARLIGLAREVESQEISDRSKSRDSLIDFDSILVFHDGSAQSHRALHLAMDMASRSLATVQLACIFGVRSETFEPSPLPEDHEWQRGWLRRLTRMYSGEAAAHGVELQAMLVASDDRQAMLDLLDQGRFDLIIIPCRFSTHSNDAGSANPLMESLAEAGTSRVLFCP